MGADRLARRLRRLIRPGGRQAGEHPTPEILVAYDADELTMEENEAIQEHFLRCRECPEMLLDLKDFTAAGPEAAVGLSENWLAWAWQRLRTRLAGERPAPRVAHALCAVLVVVAVSLSGWVAWLYAEVSRLHEPQVNVPIETLVFAAATRGGPHRQVINVPAWADRVLLILVPPADVLPDEHGGYRLVIETARGKLKWAGDVPGRSADGTVVVELPRRFLPAGDYWLRIHGVDRQGRESKVDHAVRFSYADRSQSGSP